ncbi:hypothetical protein [Ornithinibacillus contaminans]|uniref:hypothetical protein n=1 Tax=Ornithinibacillus contaminans TaxID=694055 RepID=UPI00064DD8A1|nr:hypothetical protein [Ornithinibacillus contaminans]
MNYFENHKKELQTELLLERYLFYLKHHSLLLLELLSYATSDNLKPNDVKQIEKSLYQSLYLFKFIVNHLELLHVEASPKFKDDLTNLELLRLAYTTKSCLEKMYKAFCEEPFFDRKYHRKCTLLLQELLNQEIISVVDTMHTDNQNANPPWINPVLV